MIVDFEVSSFLSLSVYESIAQRLKDRFNIKYLCTDANYAYEKIKIAKKHFTGKSETCFVESMNAKIRRKLARFNRKTCRYSKLLDIVISSLILLFNEDIIQCTFG
jgi:IS1 family transposase